MKALGYRRGRSSDKSSLLVPSSPLQGEARWGRTSTVSTSPTPPYKGGERECLRIVVFSAFRFDISKKGGQTAPNLPSLRSGTTLMPLIASAVWVFSIVLLATSVTRAADTESPASPEASKPAPDDPDHPHVSKELQAELRNQCEPDAKRLCRFVIPGGGRIYRCLETHNADLSNGCRKALAEVNPKP